MVKIDVIAYTGANYVEEHNIAISRCVELMGQYKITWINIENLDNKTAEFLEKDFGIHNLALEDSMDIEQRSKVEEYDEMLFIVTTTLGWEKELTTAQISMFLSNRFVITITHGHLPQLEDVRNRIRKKFPRMTKGGSDYLAFRILDVVVDSYIPEVEKMGDKLEKLEDDIMKSPSKEAVEAIHQFRRDLLLLRKELGPERETLFVLGRGDVPYIKKETHNYLRDVYDHIIQVLESLESYRDTSTDILNTYFSSMQLQMNEIMKLLTIIATIMLPLTLIASIYGMNLPIPESAHWLSYPLILALMLIISISMLIYFKRKKWI